MAEYGMGYRLRVLPVFVTRKYIGILSNEETIVHGIAACRPDGQHTEVVPPRLQQSNIAI